MFNRLISGELMQPEYGVALYGVPRGGGFWRYFLALVFLILIPAILLVGVLTFAKKKQFSKKERVWTAVAVLGIYFAVLIGVVLTVAYVFI